MIHLCNAESGPNKARACLGCPDMWDSREHKEHDWYSPRWGWCHCYGHTNKLPPDDSEGE